MSEETLTEGSVEPSDAEKASSTNTAKPDSDANQASSSAVFEGTQGAAAKRDMGVSTLMHLMGVASSREVTILENKIDALTSKITSLGLKIERVSKLVGQANDESYLDRIDFQLADIRNLFKRLFPKAYALGESEAEGSSGEGSAQIAEEVQGAQSNQEEPKREEPANGQPEATEPAAGASQ